jgi:hypothetical protein
VLIPRERGCATPCIFLPERNTQDFKKTLIKLLERKAIMKRNIVLAAWAIATMLLGALGSAEAGFVVSGYSSFVDQSNVVPGIQLPPGSPPATASGYAIVNFAVWDDTAAGSWITNMGLDPTKVNEGGTTAGTGLAGVDQGANYVYFYQVINTGPTDVEILQVGMNPSQASSVGYITGSTFVDGDGLINTTTNAYIGADPGGPQPQPQEAGANGVPTSAAGGVVGISTAPASGYRLPSYNSASPGPASTIFPNPTSTGVVQFNFVNPNPGAPNNNGVIVPGGSSVVLFITSNVPWGYATSGVHDTVTTYNELPAPVPLPATLALLASGIPGFLGAGWFLRRRQHIA